MQIMRTLSLVGNRDKEMFNQVKEIMGKAADTLTPDAFINLCLNVIKCTTADTIATAIESSDASQIDANLDAVTDKLNEALVQGIELAFEAKEQQQQALESSVPGLVVQNNQRDWN